MIIDKKGKLFGKVNIIDLFVAVFVILALVISVFKFFISPSEIADRKTKSTAVVEYTLKIAGIRDYTIDQFKIGEKIYSTESSKSIGKIKDIKKTEAKEMILTADGVYKEATKPDRYDVILTIETKASISKKGFVEVGEEQLLSHSEISITNRKFKTTATMIDVEILSQSAESDKSSKK